MFPFIAALGQERITVPFTLSSHVKNKPISAGKKKFILQQPQLLLIEYVLQLGIAQLLKLWNQIGHCYPYFLFHNYFHAVCILLQEPSKLTKLCH